MLTAHLLCFGFILLPLLRIDSSALLRIDSSALLRICSQLMGKLLFLLSGKPIGLLSSFRFQSCALRRRKMRREEITYEKIYADDGFTSA